jgi:Tfp pilus assembly pilus retraction ATPase PilT
MNWEIGIGLLGTAASLAGLAWDGKAVRKVAFVLLALLAATLVVRNILYQHSISQLQVQMTTNLGTSMMSADQLYENVSTRGVTRPLFDDALSEAVDSRHFASRISEFRTPDNVYIRVRVYYIP